MKQQILVLFARAYRLDKDSNEKGFNYGNAPVEGISLHYLFSDSLLPVSSEDERGIRPSKSSLPKDKGKSVIKVPGLYEADFDIRTDGYGKMVLDMKDLHFLSEIQTSYPDLNKNSEIKKIS